MVTFASLFTGGGLVDVAANSVGYSCLWGIEIDKGISDTARQNGISVINSDVVGFDYSGLESPWLLHASPPCTNYSVARIGGGEQAGDIELADAVCSALRSLVPARFTLENVSSYRGGIAFSRILGCLGELGYIYRYSLLNASEYGVPQSRKRLWLVAWPAGELIMPYDGHSVQVGWWSAVSDLVDGLEDGKLANWQIRKLADARLPHIFMVHGDNKATVPYIPAHQPCRTLGASSCGKNIQRIVMVAGGVTDCVIVKDMNMRCLARLQTVPDSYKLPDKKILAGKIIGNGVPCKQYASIARSLKYKYEPHNTQ
jgi:DNA (cytosine-5)-methyltransferase 1